MRIKSMKLTEAEFTQQVLELAKHRGWLTAHFRAARTEKGWRTAVSGDGKGFPDLVLIRHGKIVFAELKVGKNKLSEDQERWLEAVRETGASVFLWYPSDWSVIEEVLK